MTTQKRTSRTAARAATRAGSWMALLAMTTLGVDSADTVSAVVKTDARLAGSGSYRLVVQSYDAEDGELPGTRSRPVGSTQRAVTAAELKEGVKVDLVELRGAAQVDVSGRKPIVVAWVERGQPDLEYDARRARPQPGSVYGIVARPSDEAPVTIALRHRVAA